MDRTTTPSLPCSPRLSVSIALCTYNGERYLREQLDSFKNQTRLPDEVVVCDDGSTDATFEILESWKKTVPFSVNIVKNEWNLGYAQNFGKAISLCTKDVIFLSDQDDVWLPEKLDTMVRMLEENPDVGVATSDGFIIDENGTQLDGHAQLLAQNWFYDETTVFCVWHPTLRDCYPRGCATAFRASLRDILLPIPPHWSHDLWLNVVYRLRFQGKIVPQPLFEYRIYGGNWTQGSYANRVSGMDYKKRIFHWNAASQFMVNDALVSEFEERIRTVEPNKYVRKCIEYLAENRKHFRNRERIQRNFFLFAPLLLLEVLTLRYFQHFHAWQAIGYDLWTGLKNGMNPVKTLNLLLRLLKKVAEK